MNRQKANTVGEHLITHGRAVLVITTSLVRPVDS
jgi:hypothetical protein